MPRNQKKNKVQTPESIRGKTPGCVFQKVSTVKVQHPDAPYDFLIVPVEEADDYDAWVPLSEREGLKPKSTAEIDPPEDEDEDEDDGVDEPESQEKTADKPTRRQRSRAASNLKAGAKAKKS